MPPPSPTAAAVPAGVDAAGPAVEVIGATKWFGAATALDRVDCVVDRGSVHGLVGPNGAGKTTLLSLVLGLARPDEGTVRLLGRTRRDAGSGWLDGVGGFLETPQFYPYLTGRRNLLVLAGLDRGDSRDLIDQALDTVGLAADAGRKVKGYSLGMRQRLGFAAALIRRPALLVLDEPTNGLDPGATRDLRAAFRSLADRGVTVVLSSHDIAQVDEVCDAVTVLHRGAVAFTGSMQRLRADAPDPTWRLATSDDAGALRIATRTGVTVLPPSPDRVIRIGAHGDRLDSYVLALGRAGIAVRLLDTDSSPLEVLLQRLTGTGTDAGSGTGAEPDRAEPVPPTAARA